MNKLNRTLWSLALIPVLAGCSGYQHAYLPGHENPLGEIESSVSVQTGSKVRFALDTGEKFEGRVTELDSGYLEISTLDAETSIVLVEVSQIRNLEVYVKKSAAADFGVAALAVGGLVGGYYLVTSDVGSGVQWEAGK